MTNLNPNLQPMGIYENTTRHNNTSTDRVVQNASLTTECLFVRFNASEYLPWDNPDTIASEEAVEYADKIKDFVLAFCFLIGVPANVINMAVFFKQGLQDRVNLCLFVLALSDGFFLIACTFAHGENIYLHLLSRETTDPMNKFMVNSNLFASVGSVFVSWILSAIIACERCYCVHRPLKYQTLLRTRTMALVITCTIVCVFSLFYVVSYRFWIGCLYDPVTGEEIVTLTGGGLYRTHKQLIDYLDGIFFGAGVAGGMLIAVTTATVLTTVKLRQIVTWRSETSTSLSPREIALTKMLIGNSVFFIICISPSCVFRVALLFMPEMKPGGRNHSFYLATTWSFAGASFINSACNFFIYYFMGSRYRETFWSLFTKKKQPAGAGN